MHIYLESQKVVLIEQFIYSYHIILRCQEYRRKNKEKCKIIYKGKPIRITAEFSAEILKSKKAWNDVLQDLKENSFWPRLLLPA